MFSIHGPIYEIVIKTKESGQHFAFVDYPNINDAEKAWKSYLFSLILDPETNQKNCKVEFWWWTTVKTLRKMTTEKSIFLYILVKSVFYATVQATKP